MRHYVVAFAAAALIATATHAQRPTFSPALEDLARRDTSVAVWLMANDRVHLDVVVDFVNNLGGTVRHRSRWLHAVSAELDTDALNRAMRSELLSHIQPVAVFVDRNPPQSDPVSVIPRAAGPALLDTLFGPSSMPLEALNLFPLVRHGLTGSGVRIAILDTGFETEHAAFADASVLAQYDFVFGDSVVRNELGDVTAASRHGSEVWSLLAANLPNQIVGIAPEAEFLLAKTEDVRSETRVEEDNYVAALEWADSIGVDIVTSSLSYLAFDGGFSYSFDDLNGDAAITTIAADSAVARGIVVVTAAGNDGPGFRSLSTPADGDSVIAVGAEDSLGVLTNFSSRGPTADGRLKPDLTAPGRSVFVVDPWSASGFARANGTSFSAPIIAGTIALIREQHPTLSPTEILEALRRSGSNRQNPDSSSGWGRPNGTTAVTFVKGIRLTSPSNNMLTSVTPLVEWEVPDLPAFALPVTYRIRMAEDTTFSTVLLDTSLTESEVQLTSPFQGGQQLVFDLLATSVDSASVSIDTLTMYVVPEWATLTTFSDPAGATIRERRPTFSWTSPEVVSPPGPFVYDVAVLRIDNGVAIAEATGLDDFSFVPSDDLDLNTPYRWQVIAHLGPDSAIIESDGSFVVVDESIPTTTLLFQNFPNPFPNDELGVASTCIWFDLATDGEVTLDILDIRGHLVKNLVPGNSFPRTLPAGRYGRGPIGIGGRCDPRLEWDGSTANGSALPRGIYPVRLKTPVGTFFKRIVYMGEAP